MAGDGPSFTPLTASALVPGRKVLIAPKGPLAVALRRAKLLQKAKDKGALTTLVDLFAGQAAIVVQAPSIFQLDAEKADGMCKIRTSVGTTASLPIGAIGADPNVERQLKLKYERSVVHDLAASLVQEAWRLSILRHGAKALVAERRRARDEIMMEVRMTSLGRQKNMVEELAALTIQAASRGAATRRAMAAMQLGDAEPGTKAATPREEQDTADLDDAATVVQATFRGAHTRRQVPAEDAAALGGEAAAPGTLMPQAQLEAPDAAQLERALLTACASGDLHAVHVLVRDHAANLNTADDKGNGPLMVAAAAGHLDVVKFLARVGAPLALPNFAGWTPLHRACFNGHLDVVHWLLGADEQADSAHPNVGGGLPSLNVPNHFGSTPLHVAIPNGHRKVAEILVKLGASMEARNASGDTPLHFAVVCRQRSMVELLLKMGADASAPNDEGTLPARTAAATEQPDVARLLVAVAAKAAAGTGRRGTGAKSGRSRPASAPVESQAPATTAAATTAAQQRRGRSARKMSSGESVKSAGSGNKSGASISSGKRRGKKAPSLGELEKRLFRDSPAPPARQVMVGQAWRAASEATCSSVDLRPHEAATVLDVLGLELDAPPVRPPPGTVTQPADFVRLRLDDAARTTADLAAARAHLDGEGETGDVPGNGWGGGGRGRSAGTMVAVEAKHGRTARKKLLTLIRNPESGAAGFVADHPGITGWSVATGRAFLQDILELPSERLPPNAEINGLALLDIDAKYAAEDPSVAALPSILKARLLFHCELLRQVSSSEEGDTKRALAQAEQWEREAAKAAAREKAREEARAEGWLPLPSTKKAGGKRPASGGAAVSMERQQAVAPRPDGKSAKRSRLKKVKPAAAQDIAATPTAARSFSEEGGWLGDGFEAYPGLRVQVAHFSDLVESLKETSSKSLAPAELTMARRSAASRGTIIAGGKGASKLTVQLDDGLEVQLPHTALYALPSLVLHPAQLRTGATARVVHARWLRQLLLCVESDSDDNVDVGALSERLGGALVTVIGVEDLRLKHRVRVAAADGFEATLPQDALVPPPQNAHAVRLLKNRAPSAAVPPAPHRAAAPPEIGEPGFEKHFAAAVAAPRKTPQQQSATSAKSTGSVNGRSLYRDTSGGTGNASSAANMSQLPDPSVGDYEAIQGDLDDGPTLRKTIVPMVPVGKEATPERLEYVFPPAPRVPTATGKVPEEMLRDGRVLSDTAVDIAVTGSGLGVHLAYGLQGPGRGTYNRAIDEPKRQRPATAGASRPRKNWAPVNMKVFGFNELENDAVPNPRGVPGGYDGVGDMFEDNEFEDDGDVEGAKKFPHPWKPAGSGKNAIDAIYNPASNANGAPETMDTTGKNDGSESEAQPPTPIRRRPASARTRRPKGANQAGGAAWAAVRGSGDRPMTAGSSKRGLRDMPAEGLQRSTSDLTKRDLTPQEQALLASEAIKVDQSGRAVWKPAGSGKAAIDAIYNPAAASNIGLRHDDNEEDALVAAANAAEKARASLPYSPAPYASTGRAFPAGSVWTRSEENLHALLSPEKDGTLRKSTMIQGSEDENDSNESKGRGANASAKVSANAAPADMTNQRDPDDPVVRLSQASAAIPDRDLRQRLQRMDEELALRQTAQMDKFESRQKVGAVDNGAIELDGVNRAGSEHDLDGRVAAMEYELEERETELRDGPAPKKGRREAVADRHRATLMEETDERLRRQMARMDDQMQKKEQEIREALKRQKKIIADGKKSGPPGGRRVGGGAHTRSSSNGRRGKGDRLASNQNSNPNRMVDAPEAVQEMHEATHRRLFQNDVSRKVDEKLKQDKDLEERSWRAAEAEVADLAAAMDEIAGEMTRDKEREGELRTKVREMTRAQDRIERRTSELTRSMTMVKLSAQDGARRVAKLEDGLAELVLEHDAQAKDITAAEARLEVLRSHVGDGIYNIEGGASILQGLDKDATLAHGIERKHQVMRTRKRALGKAVVDVEKILNEQTERHGELTSQLAVAEMTLQAMKSVLAQGQ